jgi:hypothetical protein
MAVWDWRLRLWVGLTTLWFLWPIILALHAGSSARRAYTFVGLSAALIALPMYIYCSFVAHLVWLSPDGPNSLSPYELGSYAVGYAQGWTAAKQRAGTDPIILEAYGLGRYTPAAPSFQDEVRERYDIKIEGIAGCGVNSYILGHAKGYNTASVSEIKRRHGREVITAAEQENAARDKRYEEVKQSGRADADRDAKEGRLSYLLYQLTREGEEEYGALLREHYQVELRRVAENPQQLDEHGWAYRTGYNEAASETVARRFGENARQNLWGAEYSSVEQLRRSLAAATTQKTADYSGRN